MGSLLALTLPSDLGILRFLLPDQTFFLGGCSCSTPIVRMPNSASRHPRSAPNCRARTRASASPAMNGSPLPRTRAFTRWSSRVARGPCSRTSTGTGFSISTRASPSARRAIAIRASSKPFIGNRRTCCTCRGPTFIITASSSWPKSSRRSRPANFRKRSSSPTPAPRRSRRRSSWPAITRKRQQVIAFFGAFHGRTMGSLSLTASKVTQRRGFGPLVPGVTHIDYADCRNCP